MRYQDNIAIRGFRQNNLKNVSVDIPLNVLTVVTGIVLILTSLIFRYGAELEERNRSMISDGEK